MSKLPFVCLNVEPETDVDDEIDDTAEIQLEEALKLYQAALKLHAQGPSCFDAAQDAYNELFKSEIFTYPEALSFTRRHAPLNSGISSDGSASESEGSDASELVSATPNNAVDGAPSTLPQVLYLSFKNYAQFQLDTLQHHLTEAGFAGACIDDLDPDSRQDVLERASKCLETLCDAVDRDDSDPNVWRQMSRLSSLLGSTRLTRYCLEAVLQASSREGTALSIESALALEDLVELRKLLQEEGANMARRQSRQPIAPQIRKALDPCPGLPTASKLSDNFNLVARDRRVIDLKEPSWGALGSAILEQCKRDLKAPNSFVDMGAGYRIGYGGEDANVVDQKSGRKRRQIEHPSIRRASVTKPPLRDDEASAAEIVLSPIRTRSTDEICSPSSEQKLPMRTLSIDSSVQGPVKQDLERKTERGSSLKRSPEAAGITQDLPEARGRSKRLRAREAPNEEDALSRDLKQQIEKQTKLLSDADTHLFHVCHTLLQRMKISSIRTYKDLKLTPIESSRISETPKDPFSHAMADFRKSLRAWNINKSMLLNQGTGTGATATLISKGSDAGLASFMEHAKTGQKKSHEQIPLLEEQGVEDFVSLVNRQWLSVEELALLWISTILKLRNAPSSEPQESLYLSFRWNNQLRGVFHEILAYQDAALIRNLTDAILSCEVSDTITPGMTENDIQALVGITQSLFEIQLDVFNSMIKPTSKVDQPTRTLQKARLQRWSMLASQAVAKLNTVSEHESLDSVSLRHLFSMILYMSLDDHNDRDEIIRGLHEVKLIIRKTCAATVYLPNLDIMPEISVDAVEQEISRLTTTDFFLSVFNPSDDDPIITIESLEPILMPGRVAEFDEQPYSPSAQLTREEDMTQSSHASLNDQLQEFLEKSTASLRLSLWSRLSMAYSSIEYPPMVFVCTIKSIELVLSEIRTTAYLSLPEETRLANLVVWIRNLVDLVDKCIALTSTEQTALDGLDERNLLLALDTVAHCTRIFHLFALWDDGIRLGQSTAPVQQAGAATAYKQAMAVLRDMQVKTWRLLYILLRDAAKQNPQEFPDSDDDFLTLLAAIHSAIGLREYCRLNKKSFLKFLKPEILALEPADLNEWRYQMAQLCYDLYALRVLADSNTWMTLQEHKCPADQLDKTTAREILPMVMAQIHAMRLKDLTKPDRREFKQAIDEIQELIGTPKANSSALFNRRQLNHFQKAPLRTDELERCLKGDGGFVNMPVRNEYTSIAKTGWFFVVGYLRLASFRSVRRQGPDSTKELDQAAAYLRVDIDYDCDKWETWYRLAQVYDSMLDEEVAWTTDRINNKMDDLIGLQRQAIHCYQMAVALSVRKADDLSGPHGAQSDELAGTVSELYSDFGIRLYAASRPPFSMHAFSLKDHGRWYYTALGNKFKAQPFMPTRDAQVWLVASVFFRQALVERPSDWLNWYMLGKCLWKLLHHPDAGGIDKRTVLEAFAKACETAPAKDPRRDGSPTLEPHQKLLSVVHKLVHSRGLNNSTHPGQQLQYLDRLEGYQYLCRSPYAKKIDFHEPHGSAEWLAFVRGVLKNLRAADKTNWHHRIVTRAADLAYNDDNEDAPAKAALLQLDTIITKTMALTVWRPAFERVGRHFVYTTRYVKLIIDLFEQAGERGKLEMLGKRVRKKQAEFIDHPKIWSKICKTHIALLRMQVHIPELHEEHILSTLPFERFVYNAALLQAWAQPVRGEPPDHPLLPVLKELFDLKKLNLNLIPNQGIDDLIGDTYAKIYEEKVPGLMSAAANEKNREAMRVDRILMADTSAEEKAETSGTEVVPLTNPSGRAKIVGRMEVRRRAEALVQRLSQLQTPGMQQQGLSSGNGAEETADEADEATAVQSFEANEDADDESELTELEEDEEEQREPVATEDSAIRNEEDEQNTRENQVVAGNGQAAAEEDNLDGDDDDAMVTANEEDPGDDDVV